VYTNLEVPLLDDVNQSYVHYYKGAVAMYTVRERLGADVVNGAPRRFRDEHAGPNAPAPTSRALYAELRAVAPDSLKPLLSDLLEHITLWDVRTGSAKAEPVGDGAHRVTLFVDASKARADSSGNEAPVAVEPLYLKEHRTRAGKQAIVITVPHRPARAGIDPHRKLIEPERDDNVAEIGTSRPERGDREIRRSARCAARARSRGRAGPPAPAATRAGTPAGAPRRGAGGGGRNRRELLRSGDAHAHGGRRPSSARAPRAPRVPAGVRAAAASASRL
jgi:hypothetical protein